MNLRVRLFLLGILLAIAAPARAADSGEGIAETGSGAGSLQFLVDGTAVAKRAKLNLVVGAGMSISCVDNSAQKRVDCTFESTGGGSTFDQIAVGTTTEPASTLVHLRTTDTQTAIRYTMESTGFFPTFTLAEFWASNFVVPLAKRDMLTYQLGSQGQSTFSLGGWSLRTDRGGETSYGPGTNGQVDGNTANIKGAVGFSYADVNASTTIARTPNAPWMIRAHADAGDVVVTLQQPSFSDGTFALGGRWHRIVKADSSTHTVTVAGSSTTVLHAQGDWADYHLRWISAANGFWYDAGHAPDLSQYLPIADIPVCNETTEKLTFWGSSFTCTSDQTGGGGGSSVVYQKNVYSSATDLYTASGVYERLSLTGSDLHFAMTPLSNSHTLLMTVTLTVLSDGSSTGGPETYSVALYHGGNPVGAFQSKSAVYTGLNNYGARQSFTVQGQEPITGEGVAQDFTVRLRDDGGAGSNIQSVGIVTVVLEEVPTTP